jgi:glycosyltransferase involved in cell wall biosynthesis
MPLRDSGANNAILESLACGLPIITNDVGGIRDYGGGTIYPLAESDDASFTELAITLLKDAQRLAAIETAQRQFALGLGWDSVSARLVDAVAELHAGPQA